VIHDWDDDEAVTILEQCQKQMRAFGALLDLNMLVMTGGRERTAREFRGLLDAACFESRG